MAIETSREYQLAQAIYEQAIEVPKEQRSQFVLTACENTPNLLLELFLWMHQSAASLSLSSFLINQLHAGLDFDFNQHIFGKVVDNRYHITEFLGAGGQGSVWKAIDLEQQETVALKLYRRDLLDAHGEEFYRNEIKSLISVRHPHLAYIRRSGRCQYLACLYLVTNYYAGGSLRDLLNVRKRLSEEDALVILASIAMGLFEAHQHEVIHCDVKPENILFNENDAPILCDFGLAMRHESGSETITSLNIQTTSLLWGGTKGYLSPEQIQQHLITNQSDIYSLGIVFYEMLSGISPMENLSFSQNKYLSLQCSKQSRQILSRTMALDNTARYANIETLILDAATALKSQPQGKKVATNIRKNLRAQKKNYVNEKKKSSPVVLIPWILLALQVVSWILRAIQEAMTTKKR